jgi:hypothetical protein
MAGQRPPQAGTRSKGASLAERAQECEARQQRLREEAAERRAAAEAREADAAPTAEQRRG